MLRRRPDNTFEFRDIERALYGAAPHALSPDRREALRARIFSELGTQEEPHRAFGAIASERWIAIPVGASIAASVIAATHYLHDQRGSATGTTLVATAAGPVTVDGAVGSSAQPGQLIKATSASWVSVGENVRVGLGAGSAFRFASSDDRLALLLESGTHHIVSQEALLEVRGGRWVAHMTGPGALEVSIHQWYTSLLAIEGETVVQYAGSTYLLRPGDRPLLLLTQPPEDPGTGSHANDPAPAPFQGGGNPNPGPAASTGAGNGSRNEDAPADPVPAASAPESPGSSTEGPGEDASAPSDADLPADLVEDVPASVPPPPVSPPVGPPAGNPPATPLQDPGNGNGSPPASPGAGSGNNGNGLGNSGDHPHGGPPGLDPEGDAPGQGNPGSANAQGNGNPAPLDQVVDDETSAAPSTFSPKPGANAAPNSDAGGNSGENAAPNSNAGGNGVRK